MWRRKQVLERSGLFKGRSSSVLTSLYSWSGLFGWIWDAAKLCKALLRRVAWLLGFFLGGRFYQRLLLLWLVSWIQSDVLVLSWLPGFSQWLRCPDLMSVVVVWMSINTVRHWSILWCLLAGYLVEVHSAAPVGLYMSCYLLLYLLIQILKGQVAWHHLRTLKVFYIGGLMAVSMHITAAHVLLAAGSWSAGRVEVLLDVWLITALQAVLISCYFNYRLYLRSFFS